MIRYGCKKSVGCNVIAYLCCLVCDVYLLAVIVQLKKSSGKLHHCNRSATPLSRFVGFVFVFPSDFHENYLGSSGSV